MTSPLAALKRAVLAYEGARSSEAHSRTFRSGHEGADWALLGQVEVRGTRYVLARRVPAHGLERLTPRERQVLELIAAGHTSKVTAYELGIADATVRVLLVRVIRKLGVRTRKEAVARFHAYRRADDECEAGAG